MFNEMTQKNTTKNASLLSRTITFTTGYHHDEASSIIAQYGQTMVHCAASIQQGVPRFLKDKSRKQGWLTAQYSMLPCSTHTRSDRDSSKTNQSPRSMEIQRMVGRSLRSCIDLTMIPDMTITIDCDVLKADGSTRTAAITGGCISLVLLLRKLQYAKKLHCDPLKYLVAGVSAGMIGQQSYVDLNYQLDSQADTDMNIIANELGQIIEIQATAEGQPLEFKQSQELLERGLKAIEHITSIQRRFLSHTK